MDRRRFLMALVTLAHAPAHAAEPGATVTFLTEAQVAGDQIRLGEVASVQAADGALATKLRALDVGASPLPGLQRVLLAASARVRLRAAGFRDDQVVLAGAPRTNIRRSEPPPAVGTSEVVAALAAAPASRPAAPLVRRGARVKVLCRSGGVAIACTAEALQDGVLGQTVRLRNLNSLLDFTARVVGDGTLELNF